MLNEISIGDLIIAYTAFINTIAYFAIKIDKRRAEKKMWRASEKTLQLLSLFGGFIGSSIAMKIYRHKTKKISYLLMHLIIVILWITVLFVYIAYAENKTC